MYQSRKTNFASTSTSVMTPLLSDQITPMITFRQEVQPNDIEHVRLIVKSTDFFDPDEEDIAVELVKERLAKGEQSGYFFLYAEIESRTAGYTCYGPIPATEASYDLYWIAVHNDFRGHGMGKRLLKKTESLIAQQGGRRIYIETSSLDYYEPTRLFYLKNGYHLEATLKDFYYAGDSKLIYLKVI